MNKKIHKFIYWTPRILAILFVLFLAIFSLDVFEENYGFWGMLLGLFMHNIPALILLVVVIISWKHEIVGGIAFVLAGLVYIALLLMNSFEWYMLSWIATIAGPAFFIGILFLLNWRQKRKIMQRA